MLQTIKNWVHHLTAFFALFWYGFPAKELTVIGITGTDGKTTTTELIYHILKTAGKKVSMISTVKAMIGDKEYDTGFHVTTPSAFTLQKYIKQAKDYGDKYIVLEVTSHALDQGRVFSEGIDIGVITNISHEHLDYHKTFEKYRQAKAKILRVAKYSVLNVDDKNYEYFKNKASGKLITFGLYKDAQYTKKSFSFTTSLVGEFNDYNILASVSVAKILGLGDEDIRKAVSSFNGIKGRMEEIKSQTDFRIFLDFAHKPNALGNVLKTARSITKKKVIVVFGCAGLRDTLKRPMMGKIAGTLSDYTILTAEDPRTEDVRNIIEQIAQGCAKSGAKEEAKNKSLSMNKKDTRFFWRIPDRQEAINFAIKKLAQKGDIVIITGKGHERSMCYGKIEYPWSDEEAIKKALHDNITIS